MKKVDVYVIDSDGNSEVIASFGFVDDEVKVLYALNKGSVDDWMENGVWVPDEDRYAYSEDGLEFMQSLSLAFSGTRMRASLVYDDDKKEFVLEMGGPGSGGFDHAGRPGEVGGSRAAAELVKKNFSVESELSKPTVAKVGKYENQVNSFMALLPLADLKKLRVTVKIVDDETITIKGNLGLCWNVHGRKNVLVELNCSKRLTMFVAAHEIGHAVNYTVLTDKDRKSYNDTVWVRVKKKEIKSAFMEGKKNFDECFASNYGAYHDPRLRKKLATSCPEVTRWFDEFYATKKESILQEKETSKQTKARVSPSWVHRVESIFEMGGVGSGSHGHLGRPGEVGGSGPGDSEGKHALTPAKSRDDMPEWTKTLKIPPAWTDLRYNPNSDGKLLVVGFDGNKDQYIFNNKFKDFNAAERWGRIEAMESVEGAISSQIQQGIKDGVEEASVVALIQNTGIRPGTEDDLGAAVQAYGATTMLGSHVKVDGGEVFLDFIGKKGVRNIIHVTSKSVAKDLIERKAKYGRNAQLFKVKDHDVSRYVHTLGGGGFETKDFRTLLGTKTAAKMMASMTPPRTHKEFKKMTKLVCKAVARKLGNTPAVAQQSYINPMVWVKWRRAWD